MGSQRRYYRGNSYDRERAERHVLEAKQFSEEMGGTDEDVKKYFFSLPWNELNIILKEYGRQYGASPEEYARDTFDSWRTGRRRMSGLVAKRLFALLPPRMPLEKKYELADNIWRNFAPQTEHNYKIGRNANIDILAGIISNKLNDTVSAFNIPINIKNRFAWLSAGDIRVEEQLLNHFRQQLKSLAVQKIILEVPVLQQQINESPEYTGLAKTKIIINKNEVSIVVDKSLDTEILETQRPSPAAGVTISKPAADKKTGCLGPIIVLIIVILILLYLSA